MRYRRVLVQLGGASAERLISAAIQGVTMLLVARAVTPGQFGLLSSVLGVAWVAQAVSDLGISSYLIRERARNSRSGYVTAALKHYGPISIMLSVIGFALLTSAGLIFDRQYFTLLPLSIWIAADRNADAWLSIAFADGDWTKNVTSVIARRFASLAILLVLLFAGTSALLAMSIAWASSSLVALLSARQMIIPLLPEPVPLSMRSLIRQTYPYWQHSVAMQVRQLDAALLGMTSGAVQAGAFAAASRLTSPLRILPTSLAKAVLPAFSRDRQQEQRQGLFLLCGGILAGVSTVYIVLAVLTPTLVIWTIGEPYRPAITPMQIVLVGLPFAAASSILGSILQGYGAGRYLGRVSTWIAVGYLIMVVLGARFDGATGAAIVLMLSYIAQCVLCGVYLWKLDNSPSRDIADYERSGIALKAELDQK